MGSVTGGLVGTIAEVLGKITGKVLVEVSGVLTGEVLVEVSGVLTGEVPVEVYKNHCLDSFMTGTVNC